jgi:hypothetical protein
MIKGLDADLVVRLDAEVLLPNPCHLITNFQMKR